MEPFGIKLFTLPFHAFHPFDGAYWYVSRFTSGFHMIWPRGHKTIFMLNSAEHEILSAHKYENIQKFSICQTHKKHRMQFFLLKM